MKTKHIEICLNKWRMLAALVGIIAVLVVEMLTPELMLKFSAALCLLFALGGLLDIKLSFKMADLIWFPAALAAALFVVVYAQLINEFPFDLSRGELLLGVESAVFYMLLLYCILLPLLRNSAASAKLSIFTVSAIFVALSIINYFTAINRGKGISPSDINAIGTALSVAGNYSFSVSIRMVQAVGLLAAAGFFMSGIKTEKSGRLKVRFAVAALVLAATVLHLNHGLKDVKILHWNNDGCMENGLVLNLTGQLRQEIKFKPRGYDMAAIEELQQDYAEQDSLSADELPNVVVIMNESLSDLRVWAEFETNIPVTPFLDSLQENTIKGNALASVLGGMTANSEYEFLSGNSMLFHSPSSIPFQQYIKRATYSLEKHLAQYGYSSYFTHPWGDGKNWNRDKAYQLLGFDESSYEQAYKDCEVLRIYPSDEAVYDNIIRHYESMQGKKFIFTVTMQNHGPYEYSPGVSFQYDEEVLLKDYEMGQTREYFSLLREADKAFEQLIEYFKNSDEPVVVLMFGDHQPVFSPEFGAMLGYEQQDDFPVDMTQYIVPFYIWANYDIEEEYVELSSLNFLSNYLLEAAGIPLSAYNRFLRDFNEVVPAMNAYGYWSEAKGGFAEYKQAEGEEKQWLQRYEILQYNSLFDKKNKSEVFFPEN